MTNKISRMAFLKGSITAAGSVAATTSIARAAKSITKKETQPLAGVAKASIIAGLIITGSLMMVKNFTGTPFSNGVIIFLDVSHLVFCMGLLFLTAME